MTSTDAPSAPPETLAAALAVLQTRLPRIGKNADGIVREGRRLKYADLADVSADLLPLLGEVGLSFSCKPTVTADGKFVLAYRLRHVSGEDDSGEYPLSLGTPQVMGGLITYARRYCLLAVTGAAPGDEDDDAQAAEQAEQAARAQRNAPPEVRGDGSATEAEQSRMSRGPEPGAWRAHGTAENDGFYDQPGQPDGVAAEERPGSATPDQIKGIQAEFGLAKIQDRESKLRMIAEITGQQVRSSRDLSYVQAGAVYRALRARNPGPAAPDETPVSGPAAGPGTTRERPDPTPAASGAPAHSAATAKPSKAATEKLQGLLRQIPLGPDEDVAALIAAWTGKPLEAALTAADVKTVTTTLADALEHAGGNGELAASRIWEQQHKQVTGA